MSNFKLKFLLLNILFIINLNAEAIREQLFTSVLISTDGKTFLNLKEVGDFNKLRSKLTFKLKVNKEIIKDQTYYLRISCNIENFINTNVPYVFKNDLPVIKIDKNVKDNIILNFDFKNKTPFIELAIFNDFEYKYIMNDEKILFGIAYGIMICAFFYNFIFFLYNREKFFLYYSILQISLISVLIAMTMNIFIFNLFEKYGDIVEITMFLLLDITFVFSILFHMEFLNTKKYIPKMHKFLWFVLSLNLLDIILLFPIKKAVILEYIPSYVILIVLLFSAFLVLKEGYKLAIFYIIGMLCLATFVFLAETSFSDYSENYLLHIGIPLESLLFSLGLGFKIKQIELDKQINEGILINQSKLASMGEMIGNIAHQWRQPLTHLSYIIMNLNAAYENDKLDTKYLEKKTDEANSQIEFMSHTIDDFRNFFKVSKQKEDISLVALINESITLLKESFKSLDIQLEFIYANDLRIKTYKGELSQVVFNLLNNAKDEFIRRDINDSKILITLYKNKKNIMIEVSDNAGGIDEKIIKKIFEPYFTTKDKGLGIGLYMSKTIIEKNIEGKLEVKNIKDGVLFIITLPPLS